MQAIETAQLTKDYGNGRGLFDLNLEVGQEEIFGFLGPNGAGKTTTIRLLMDMIRPDLGHARVLGLDAHTDSVAVKREVGYLPGELPEFGRMRGSEIVGYIAGLRRIDATRRIAELCERFHIDLAPRYKELSRGNKQKLGLLLAFMHEPRLLILDEPTSGLDPLMQEEFHVLVREVRHQGATVFLSSHVLSEVEQACDRAAIVREGRLAQVVKLDQLHGMRIRHLEITFADPPDEELLRNVAGVEDVSVVGSMARCTVRGLFGPLIKTLAGRNILSLTSREPSLEELFLNLYRSANHS
ncbi:MAG: ABC transporter ATP-binding protein [Actinobacteria bacterium]|nr:ABC transporter ATP-binding protein [Actinomycetota bacterium]